MPRRASVPQFPTLKESDITKQVKDFMLSRRWNAFRLQSGLVRGFTRNRDGSDVFIRLAKKGTPDWVFVRGNDAVFVEMKAPRKTLSQHQQAWFGWAKQQGIKAIWADGLGAFMEKYERIYPG